MFGEPGIRWELNDDANSKKRRVLKLYKEKCIHRLSVFRIEQSFSTGSMYMNNCPNRSYVEHYLLVHVSEPLVQDLGCQWCEFRVGSAMSCLT